jgi:triacylglycerol lipase
MMSLLPKCSANFETETAIFLAALCHQAQLFSIRSRQFRLPQNYRLVTSLQHPFDRLGIVIESPQSIIIAYKGTDIRHPFELLIDIDLFQIPYPFVAQAGLTHRGFTLAYSSVRESVIETLKKLSPQKTLFITGNSLGAGLATLCALDVARNTSFHDPIVYTIASPRVGDPQFANTYQQSIKNNVRIVNVHDVIPLEPQERYDPPFTENGIYYQHVNGKFPISFQRFNLLENHLLVYYFTALSQLNPTFSQQLCSQNPGFCPGTPSRFRL